MLTVAIVFMNSRVFAGRLMKGYLQLSHQPPKRFTFAHFHNC